MVIWIGQQVSGDMVAKLFGVTSQAQINMDMVGPVVSPINSLILNELCTLAFSACTGQSSFIPRSRHHRTAAS